MGGCWERLIRTIRKVFVGITNISTRMSDEVLETLFCEIESIVNSRPKTKVSDDVQDDAALTPNQLLHLGHGMMLAPGKFHEAEMYRRRWRCTQYLVDQFWQKWLNLYIPELQRRQKWQKVAKNVQVGDLILTLLQISYTTLFINQK